MRNVIMRNTVTRVGAAVAVLASAWLMQSPQAAGRQETSTPADKMHDGARSANPTSREIEQGIWSLLNDEKAPFVSDRKSVV